MDSVPVKINDNTYCIHFQTHHTFLSVTEEEETETAPCGEQSTDQLQIPPVIQSYSGRHSSRRDKGRTPEQVKNKLTIVFSYFDSLILYIII